MTELDTQEIQGIILSGYGHLPFSSYLFLGFTGRDGARKWLREITDAVTTAYWPVGANGKAQKPDPALNLAFTRPGLAALGLADDELQTFSQEFYDGITAESRPRRLGDTGASDPSQWEIGNPERPETAIHALLILQAKTPEELAAHRASLRERLAVCGVREVLPAETGCISTDSHEHFGFRDSISQPDVEGSPNTAPGTLSCIPAGEFVLGYPNAYGLCPLTPAVRAGRDGAGILPTYPAADKEDADRRDFGKNGSYLVFRKLAQDVFGFRAYLRAQTGSAEDAERLAAKMVGRWRDGTPLALSPDQPRNIPLDQDPPNQFGYAETDADGYGCPFGAHIRRTNPRDTLVGSPEESVHSVSRHRLLRRGTRYGEPLDPEATLDDGAARGLLFLCVNADIARQFEFVQQTWANNPRFAGLISDSDPLIGLNRDPEVANDPGPWTFTIPQAPVRRRVQNLPRFVRVVGGGYFFLPSISALQFLAALK